MKYVFTLMYGVMFFCNASVQAEIVLEKILSSFSLMSVDADTPIVPVADTQGMVWRDDLHYLTYLVFDENNQLCFRTYPFDTIDSSGFFRLAGNVSNQITISVSDVTLDLNGHTVSGGTNGIVVNGGLSNITLMNGTINSVTTEGILVSAGCTDITLKNITVKNAIRGINFEQVSNGIIRNCDMNLNTTGLEIDTSHNIVIENCSAQANTNAGFSLLSSTTCSFFECKALSTGDGNASSSGDPSFVFGFVSSGGTGNLFENCVANSTQNLVATDFNTIVAGIALKQSEQASKIIGCEAGNSTTDPDGFSVPYGIWLEGVFDGLVTQTIRLTESGAVMSNALAWSPDGKYLVAGIVDPGDQENLGLFEYKRDVQRLDLVDRVDIGGNILHLDWSPDGQFIAVAFNTAVFSDFRIYEFDQINKQLNLVDSFDHAGNVIGSSWSADGNLVAFSGTVSGGINRRVFVFDRVNQSLGSPINGTSATEAETIDFSPTDNTLLAYADNGGTVLIERVDIINSTLLAITSLALSTGQINKIQWSPDGKYIAVASDATGDDAQILLFENDTLTLITGVKTGSTQFSSWAPDSRLLAIGRVNNVDVYEFDRQAGQLTQLDTISFGDTVREGEWSPDGELIAVGGDSDQATPVDIAIYSGLTFPTKNVIQNNTTYCNSGNRCPGGCGISGSSISNMIIENTAFDNAFNYIFVTNVFNQLFGDAPTALQNNSVKKDLPLADTIDFPVRLRRIELLAESLIDNLL